MELLIKQGADRLVFCRFAVAISIAGVDGQHRFNHGCGTHNGGGSFDGKSELFVAW
ncbi:MAG: hypothetical protein GY774_34840 [Planctomycetes bacterium]|nr:hypothetical protein [Planctomycetota bacterium]